MPGAPSAANRREFLTGAAAGGVAIASAGFAAHGFVQPAPSRRIIVGVMGLSRGLSLARTFAAQPGVEVRYLAEVDSQRGAQAVEAFGQSAGPRPQLVEDFRRILDDREVDALICAAPNHWHAPATILACSAGKHVYVEKPCSHTCQEGAWMVTAARKHGRAVQVGTQRRSGPGFQQAMQQLREGIIGTVHVARAWYTATRGPIHLGATGPAPPHLNYDLWQGPAPRSPYVENRIPYNWHWFWHWGNGELGNNGVHTIDLCRWGLQVDFPVRVTSSGGRYWFRDDQETPDTHTVVFEFPGGKSLIWDGQSCNAHGGDRFIAFYGSDGALELDSDGRMRLYSGQDELIRDVPARMTDDDHAANFLQAIRSEDPSLLTADVAEGHRSALLCHLGNIAWRTGRVLTCRPEDGTIIGDDAAGRMWTRDYEPGWAPAP